MTLADQTTRALGPAGTLARNWDRFEYRAEQLDFALAAARAIDNRSRLVAEAGTGTGKTVAYLAPLILSGRRAIVSTATKNLQEQITGRDLPQLSRLLGRSVEVCLVKGRRNYLCRARFEAAVREGRLDAFTGQKLAAWQAASDSGDLAELDFISEADPILNLVTASSDQCPGSECPQFEDCFITLLRRRAQAAGLVVANHHLFMADLALKLGGHGQVLPESEVVVFDEAHEIYEAATAHFTVSISDARIGDLVSDLRTDLPRISQDQADNLMAETARLMSLLTGRADTDRFPLTDDRLTEPVRRAAGEVIDRLEMVAEQAEPIGPEGQLMAGRAREMADSLTLIVGRLEPDYVYYADRLARSVSLKAAPVEVASLMQRALFSQAKAFIFTSATIDPPVFRERVGLREQTEEFVFPSPFDYPNHSRLYVPARMPSPSQTGFAPAVAEEMERLVNLTGGRAFLLFTSFRNLDYVHRLLAPRLGFPCLKQGQAPKSLLIEDFLRLPGSVLMATASFWQGVDIPGPALSLVAIDKLPFAPPDDPLVAARVERLRNLGRNPFVEYQVPEAAQALRQGLGRLIRQSSDKGILAVLDARLFTKSYGRLIRDGLPPSPIVRDWAELAEWAGQNLAG